MITKKIIIHLVDWNWDDKAYLFPEKKLVELKSRLLSDKISRADWAWFFENATLTKGIEDASFFLDYTNARESVEEWDLEEI